MEMTSISTISCITSVRTCRPVQNIYSLCYVLCSALHFVPTSHHHFRYCLHLWRLSLKCLSVFMVNTVAKLWLPSLSREHCVRLGKSKTADTAEDRHFSQVTANECVDDNVKNTSRELHLIRFYYTTDRLDLHSKK
jgi:hypothetical protein